MTTQAITVKIKMITIKIIPPPTGAAIAIIGMGVEVSFATIGVEELDGLEVYIVLLVVVVETVLLCILVLLGAMEDVC